MVRIGGDGEPATPWGGLLCTSFFLACVLVGFVTMIVYSIGLYNGWRLIVCGS